MPVTIVPWPAGLPKCPAAWDATWAPSPTVRTEMEGGMVKVRRRFTKPVRRATAVFMLTNAQIEVFKQLYENDTLCGVWPMMVETPLGTGHVPQAWRFASEPAYTALGRPLIAWQAQVALEQLPYWG